MVEEAVPLAEDEPKQQNDQLRETAERYEALTTRDAEEFESGLDRNSDEREDILRRTTHKITLVIATLIGIATAAIVLMVFLWRDPVVRQVATLGVNILTVLGFVLTVLIWHSGQIDAMNTQAEAARLRDGYERKRQEAEESLARSIAMMIELMRGEASKDHDKIRSLAGAVPAPVLSPDPGLDEVLDPEALMLWLGDQLETVNPNWTLDDIAEEFGCEPDVALAALNKLKGKVEKNSLGFWQIRPTEAEGTAQDDA